MKQLLSTALPFTHQYFGMNFIFLYFNYCMGSEIISTVILSIVMSQKMIRI